MSDLAERFAWADSAACREHPKEMFFPEDLSSRQRRTAAAAAFALCGRCPVRLDCLQAAIDADEFDRGIWGGLDAAERRRLVGINVPHGRPGVVLSIRRALGERTPVEYLESAVQPKGPTPPQIEHGTSAGHRQHLRLGIEPCRDCLHAHAMHQHYTRPSRARSMTA